MSALLDHELDDGHREWIARHVVPDLPVADVVRAMAVSFPELRPACGFYACPAAGRVPHCWLVDADGGIVDPTRARFPSQGLFSYEELRRAPTGRCPGCGVYLYDGASFCDAQCADAVALMLEAA